MPAVYATLVAPVRAQLTSADTTTYKTCYDNSAGTRAVRVEGISIVSDDSAIANIQFAELNGGTTYPMGTVRVPALSGSDGAAVRVAALGAAGIGSLAPDGIYDIWVAAGAKLQVRALAAITAAKTVTVIGRARVYE